MAEIQPLRTLRYEPAVAGPLGDVIAPPYDVIDDALRAELAARSPYNVVEIDLPRADGGDPYARARETMADWRSRGVLVHEDEPAMWVLEQDYTAPDGGSRRRRGFFARVRVDEYGPGRIRPHERTHPGPKEDRLRLTRATGANLSPIFSLFPDPHAAADRALGEAATGEPFASPRDHEGTVNRLWRAANPDLISELQMALADAELLIADGHHRYETARAYAEEVGGEGDHRYVLMLLCSLSDPGLTIFPTHRLVKGDRGAIRAALERDFELEPIDASQLEPPPTNGGPVALGYLDSAERRPYRATLRDQAIADRALEGMPGPYRRLDTAVLEALILRGALGMTEDDISHLNGLGYSKDYGHALSEVESGDWDAGFFLRATPVDQVREVAATGEPMPPKSTYFYPKIPTGLVFNLLR
jgi:uncharacterized protein (DUF1015 family)